MKNKLPRTSARMVRCPRCDAGRKQLCHDDGVERAANHVERVQKYHNSVAHQRKGEAPMTPIEREELRQLARRIECPRCGAGVDERCRSRRPEGRQSVHAERFAAYARVFA